MAETILRKGSTNCSCCKPSQPLHWKTFQGMRLLTDRGGVLYAQAQCSKKQSPYLVRVGREPKA